MRTLRLARIAAEGEALRLRKQAQRMIVRLVMGIIALGFDGRRARLLPHVHLVRLPSVGGLDDYRGRRWPSSALTPCWRWRSELVALLSSPGRVELEALQVRRRALENATTSLALSSNLPCPAVRTAINLLRRPR